MSRPKKDNARIHITATISPENHAAIYNYCKDEKNKVPNKRTGNYESPSLSAVVDAALTSHLRGYL